MAYALEILGALAAIYLVSASLRGWSYRSRLRTASRQFGCQPAKHYPNWDPFLGLDLFVTLRRADTRGQLSQAYADLHKRCGNTFEMKALTDSGIQTADPQNIQAVLATKFNDFGVSLVRGNGGAPFFDRGVFTDDGEFWKQSRSLIRPTFNRVEIANLDSFERHIGRFLALIPRDSASFDIQHLAKKLFLDTSSEFLFGKSIESLLPQTPFDTGEFIKAFDDSLHGLALRLLAGPLRFLFVLDPTWKKAYTKVHTFVDKQVSNAIEMQRGGTNDDQDVSNAGPPKKYILLHEMARITQDPLDLRSQILNVFIPARDTAAIAFGNIMFELARHPQIWSDLRAEILAEVSSQKQIDFDLLKSLRYCKAVINETLRLHLPVSRVKRIALRDTVLPIGGGRDEKSPLFVPKGQLVELDLYTLQRDPEIWGPDADEFRPSRWATGRPLWEAKWQYEPFMGGPRICPAQGQVHVQLTYLLVRVVQNFRDIENRDDELAYVEEMKLTSESRNGAKIALIPA
ncbi:MAG: hypothetical protein Q9195_006104 [Heterodermia aff. obscurata]